MAIQTAQPPHTRALQAMAPALLANPTGRHHAYDLSRAAGIRAAATYRTLDQLLAAGWAADGWETPAEASGREPRRYYVLTDIGCRELAALLTTATSDLPEAPNPGT